MLFSLPNTLAAAKPLFEVTCTPPARQYSRPLDRITAWPSKRVEKTGRGLTIMPPVYMTQSSQECRHGSSQLKRRSIRSHREKNRFCKITIEQTYKIKKSKSEKNKNFISDKRNRAENSCASDMQLPLPSPLPPLVGFESFRW